MNHAMGSDEYTELLRLLQDYSSLTASLPSAFFLQSSIQVDRSYFVGKGGDTVVYPGSMNGQSVVVRQLFLAARKTNQQQKRDYILLVHREAIIHSLLHHEHILPFLGLYHEKNDDNVPHSIFPFVERGSLEDLVNLKSGQMMELPDFIKIVCPSSSFYCY
ncbi:hypothetical protein DL93DRAFT_1752151 [Clavulina sp. PMI_390]|nr:hypothetical protein DL93DRAFT_1752151 [Clavulina sp. PMI_390]